MATVIDTPSATANSYAAIDFVKEQWDINPNIDYSALTDEQIGNLAIFATQSIDNQYGTSYKGELYDSSYALFWPRTGVYDRKGVLITDYTVYPEDLQKAVAAQAWYLNSVDLIASETSSTISGIKSQSFEGLGAQEFFSTSEQKSALYKSPICNDAKYYLTTFVSASLSPYFSTMQRG